MKVYIGVPAYGPIDPAFVSSLVGFVTLLHMAGHEAELDMVSNCSLIAKARSQIVNRFMASGYDKLLFIDADIGFEPLDAYKLCHRPESVIGGVYRTKEASVTCFTCDPIDDIEVAYIGTGFLKIERHVFDVMAGAVPECEGKPHYFNCGIVGGEYVGEDVQFCRTWRSLGGTIHVHPCKLTHYGRFGYTADFDAWKKAIRESRSDH